MARTPPRSMILNGIDGLKEVAEKEGRWNWVLVGPNPDELPLVGGGSGSVKEMRECLKKQEVESKAENQFANFYGLLRVSFGIGRMARKKFVFVQASRMDERQDDESRGLNRSGTGVSAVKHGQAMSQRGAMEKALLEFVHFSAKLEVTRLEDLSVSNIVEKCQKGSTADADLLTVDSYLEALEEWYKSNVTSTPVVPEEAAKRDNDKVLTEACVAEIFNEECAPTAEVKESVQEVADDKEVVPPPPETTKEDKPAEAPKEDAPAGAQYQKGDLLFVYSNASKQWMDDGSVVAVLDAAGEHDGLKLPKDSVKVQYNNRRQFKWVTPSQSNQYLRKSKRPVPPLTLLGELLKETHNWITQWHVRYFELSKGYLQWWMSADDAKAGVVPNGSLSLTGLEMTVQDTVMYLRTASAKGMIYAFDATTLDSAGKWSSMLKQHEEYCKKMQAYLTEQANVKDQAEGAEKLQGLVQARKRRASMGVSQPEAAITANAVAAAMK